ncbi:conserved hypothetical protein [Azospirillaceae bacterium]
MSRLLDAAARGDLGEVKRLVAKGADVNVVDRWGATALHWAARHGHTAMVEFLVAKGVDVDAVDQWGATALHWTVEKGHAAIVELLITKGANVNPVDQWGATALHWAAGPGHGHISIIEFLIANGADVNVSNKEGNTPLQLAAARGHALIVEFLTKIATAQPKTDDRRDAVLALLAQDGTMRQRLGIKADLEVAPGFDVERLIRYAIKKREAADPTLAPDVEAGIEFHIQAANMLSAEAEGGKPMVP